MAQVTLPNTSKSDSDANLFSDVFDNDDAIITVVNGSIDTDNLADNAVTSSKLSLTTQTASNAGVGSLSTTFADVTDLTVSVSAGDYVCWAVLGAVSTNVDIRFVVDGSPDGGAGPGSGSMAVWFTRSTVVSEVKVQAKSSSGTPDVVSGKLIVMRFA